MADGSYHENRQFGISPILMRFCTMMYICLQDLLAVQIFKSKTMTAAILKTVNSRHIQNYLTDFDATGMVTPITPRIYELLNPKWQKTVK